MDREQNILKKMFKICKQEKIDKETFRLDKKPSSNEEREIKKEYADMIRTILTKIPIHKVPINDKNDNKTIKDIKLCLEGAYREFLKSIKDRYDEKIWGIKKKKAKKIKNLSKRKVCLG